jgi:hypothetical protein
MASEECPREDKFPADGGAATSSSICSICTLILSEF